MNNELTKDADRLLCLLYKQYLEKHKAGIPKVEAKLMGGSDDVQRDLLPKVSVEDVDETFRELDRAGFLSVNYYDDLAYSSQLTDLSIVVMENRFKDGLKGVLEFLAHFIP